MINVLVVRREPFDDELQHFQFRFRRRQNFFLENFLRWLDPRNVRVAEHGEAVGLHFQNGVERFVERLRRLERQAVNQIQIDRAEAEFAHPVHRLLRHLARLDAMDRLLHFRIKILHAHRGAVEADFAQRDHVFAREPARVHLHARLDVRRKM